MALFSVLFLIFSYWQFSGLWDWLQSITIPSQIFCKDLLNFASPHLDFYQALACGTPIKNSNYEVLKTVSLWHLVVVSAGHFKVIRWILNLLLPRHRKFQLIPLLLYCFLTGAQPPIVRAYFELLITSCSTPLKLWIPSPYSLFYSGCLCLLVFPNWANSWSLLLCWLCAIILQLLKNQNALMISLGISLGTFPVIIFFSTPHPLSFLFNLVFAPVLSIIFFPAALVMMIAPQVHYLADPALDVLLGVLRTLAGSFANTSLQKSYSPHSYQTLCWLYVLTLQFILLKRRKPQHEIT